MALDFKNYENAVKYGAKYNGTDIKAASVPGTASTLSNQYVTIAVPTQSTTAVNVFGSSTAPVAGTITAYGIVSAGVNGNCVLFGTTAGTIATISIGSTTGTFTGTAVVNASVAAGDSVQIYTTAATGTGTAFITFQTAN